SQTKISPAWASAWTGLPANSNPPNSQRQQNRRRRQENRMVQIRPEPELQSDNSVAKIVGLFMIPSLVLLPDIEVDLGLNRRSHSVVIFQTRREEEPRIGVALHRSPFQYSLRSSDCCAVKAHRRN